MNTKDNQRSRLTKLLMKQAYIHLMHEKSTARITVKDICAGAEVNRSTFYRFIISGSIDLLTEWIRTDYAISEQAEGELLYNLCEGCVRQAESMI